MAKALDIISRALKDIGALEAGESPSADAVQDAFDMLNDMVGQWSNEDMMVFYKNEIIFPITPGQTQYTIGPGGQIGCSFVGSIAGNVLTITSINSGGISIGQTITGLGVTPGTKIVQFLTGAGGNVNEAGTYLVNIPQSLSSLTFTGYYQRPLTINSAFVRINTNSNGIPINNGGLDYPISILHVEDYEMIGLKTLNGPWPKAL